jgi:hypothetical protein
LDDIPEEAMVIEYVIVLYSHYSFLTSFLCVIRGYRSRLDEEVDNARPNDPVMLGAQFELDLSTDPYQYTMDATESSNHFASNPNAPGQRVAAPMQSGGALSSNSDDLANESIVVLVAFSQDQDRKYYVTDALKEPANRERVWEIVNSRDGVVIICGSAKNMPKDVRAAIKVILVDKLTSVSSDANVLSVEDAGAQADRILQTMEREKRYIVEAWC